MEEKKKRTKVPGSGRKKGTPNKTTADLKKWMLDFINKYSVEFEKQFERLDDEKKMEVLMIMLPKLMPYVIPKQTESKISLDEGNIEQLKESVDKINEMFK